MSSPSLLCFCQTYERNGPVVHRSLSPSSHKFFEHSPSNFPSELPLPEAHGFAGYPWMNPGPSFTEWLRYPETSWSTQTHPNPHGYPQSLFSPSLAYSQTWPISPRLANSSLDFAPTFSQESSPNFSASDITSSFLFPHAHEQFNQVGIENSYLEPDGNEDSWLEPEKKSIPILNLEAPHGSFFSNSQVPVMQSRPQAWATEQATTTPEPKTKRKATTSKMALPASTPQSDSHPVVPGSRTKSDQPQRGKRSPRSIHLILTNSPVSVTQGGYARKYACPWEGCGKAFTTSGHLVRHKRIHTGEKRYQCAMENCTSRFSRQDNMLQHYRTHFSSKPRRIPSPSSVTPNPSPSTTDPSHTNKPTMVVPQLGSVGRILAAHSSI